MPAHTLRPLLGTLAGLVLILPLAASAQSFDITSSQPFTLSVSPQYPAPYGQATLSELSSSLNLAGATMTVFAGGKQVYQGNVQPVAVTLGGAGILTNVKVIVSINGTQYSQTLAIRPQDVSLVAEPVSSAPPLYAGKPLVPLEGNTRMVAVANLRDGNGRALDPSTLSYAWTVNGTQIASASGIGKNAIIVASPLQYRESTVSVTVVSQDGNFTGGASFSLTAAEPIVRIYKNDPLLGILYDHALADNYAITGTEASLYAAPFSFPTSAAAPLLEWFLNGAAAQTGNSITLRPTGSGGGNASLSLVASSGDFTKATASLSLSFGAQTSGNPFGL